MKRSLHLTVAAIAILLMGQATPQGRFIRTFPPEDDRGIAGSSGPRADEGEPIVASLTLEPGAAPYVQSSQRINDAGEIVGWIDAGGGVAHGAIYRSGAWVDLGVPAGWTLAALFGISATGDFAGYTFLFRGGTDATWTGVWGSTGDVALTADGGPAAGVGLLPPDGFYYGINDSLNRVGCRNRDDDTFPDPHRAIFVEHPATLDEIADDVLGPLGGSVAAGDYTCLRAVNNSNLAAGDIQPTSIPSGQACGFVYDRGSDSSTYIGSCSAAGYPFVFVLTDINESGTVVGQGRVNSTWGLAISGVKWDAVNGVTATGDLALDPASTDSRANGISNDGWIAGHYLKTSIGEYRGWVGNGTQAWDVNTLQGFDSATYTIRYCYDINSSHVAVCTGFVNATPAVSRAFKLSLGF